MKNIIISWAFVLVTVGAAIMNANYMFGLLFMIPAIVTIIVLLRLMFYAKDKSVPALPYFIIQFSIVLSILGFMYFPVLTIIAFIVVVTGAFILTKKGSQLKVGQSLLLLIVPLCVPLLLITRFLLSYLAQV